MQLILVGIPMHGTSQTANHKPLHARATPEYDDLEKNPDFEFLKTITSQL
ncbi:hypothetical protein MKW98_001190 [Papaver atlanticum]|uniref:Lipoxygenase domain-containing protein n=1 Tax=Papaver atlanticum TaxID=357466 RepID=A0AAD4XKZ0_9MAGN|nr:hypothetical protein MKW98_001190 [Papaver atlanticum]